MVCAGEVGPAPAGRRRPGDTFASRGLSLPVLPGGLGAQAWASLPAPQRTLGLSHSAIALTLGLFLCKVSDMQNVVFCQCGCTITLSFINSL